ncbi:hypothetical protein ColKHC_03575 [Colletotrichum higginsianum]|nr:hypothetical protein ColKHC_03575 [Colletotrichum higginsianum]
MREGMLVAFNLHNIILRDVDENDAKDVVDDNSFARENFMARAKGKPTDVDGESPINHHASTSTCSVSL